MSFWDLDFQKGWRVGLLLSVLLLGAAVGLLIGAFAVPLSALTYLLSLAGCVALAGAVYVGYWLAHSVRAEYGLDRNGLLIHWGGYTELIPLPAITAVETETPLTRVRGVRWPGLYFGWARDAQGRPVRCFTTGLQNALVLRTATHAYALTPQDRAGFLEGLQQRLEMGPTQELVAQRSHPRFLDWRFWHDPLAVGLFLAGAFLSLALSGWVFITFPLLPATLTLRAATETAAALTQASVQLFRLPAVGAVVWTLHALLGVLLYRRERTAALLLWGVSVAFELALWGAVVVIVVRAG